MKKYLILLSFFIGCIAQAQTTTYYYDLKVSSISVGNLTVSKEIKGNQKKFTADSESVIHLFGSTTVKTHQEVVYKNNVLISSINQIWKNGVLNDETQVIKVGNDYAITKNGTTNTLSQPIDFSSIRLYFSLPTNVSKVFSEIEGIYKNIIAKDANTYQLSDNGNHVNSYIYENGVLTEAVINHTLFNILIQIKE